MENRDLENFVRMLVEDQAQMLNEGPAYSSCSDREIYLKLRQWLHRYGGYTHPDEQELVCAQLERLHHDYERTVATEPKLPTSTVAKRGTPIYSTASNRAKPARPNSCKRLSSRNPVTAELQLFETYYQQLLRRKNQLQDPLDETGNTAIRLGNQVKLDCFVAEIAKHLDSLDSSYGLASRENQRLIAFVQSVLEQRTIQAIHQSQLSDLNAAYYQLTALWNQYESHRILRAVKQKRTGVCVWQTLLEAHEANSVNLRKRTEQEEKTVLLEQWYQHVRGLRELIAEQVTSLSTAKDAVNREHYLAELEHSKQELLLYLEKVARRLDDLK